MTTKKSAHFKKVEKRNQQKNYRDGSVACKNYKQTKRASKEEYEGWN